MEKYQIYNRRYLGSKTRLLQFIEDIINDNCNDCHSFFDVFGGTGVVGFYFNKRYSIIENDLLACNVYSHKAFIGDEKVSNKKIVEIITELNNLKPRGNNYYGKNFADTYLSKANMIKVGAIRDRIDSLRDSGEINDREEAVLITSLIYAIDHIANTVGHYDAYRKGGDLNKELILKPLDISPSKNNKGNTFFQMDSNELAKIVKADIAYLDPPYNSRQYADAYHFLENVARNEKPPVEGVARKMDRSRLKSRYNEKSAPKAFDDLITNLDARYILVSYNNMAEKGNSRSNAKISDEEILYSLKKRGAVKIFEKDFSSFTTGKTRIEDHKERVFFCEVGNFNDERVELKNEVQQVQSPLNYTGGKFKLLNQIKEHLPNGIETFYDVFCGGANIGSNVECDRIICVDNCFPLINLLNFLKENSYGEINAALEESIQYYNLSDTNGYGYGYYGCDSDKGVGQYNSEKYKRLKDDYNTSVDKPSILFLLLIMFGFNNQIRFNSKGQFNLPVGKRDYNKSLRKKLRGFMANIHAKNVSFECRDFESILDDEIDPNTSFMYLDPPYSLGDATYNENGGWNEIEDDRLFNFLDICNNRGIRFALSNVIEHKGKRNTKLIEWAIAHRYNIHHLKMSYDNSSYNKSDRQSKTQEVLITNYWF